MANSLLVPASLYFSRLDGAGLLLAFRPVRRCFSAGIVIVQALLLFVATVVFAAAVASRFAPRRRVWIAVPLATMLAFQQGYFLFSGFLLSDALAWALLLLLLSMVVASGSLLGQFGYTRFAWTYLVLGWMAIGARDANQQVLLVVTAICCWFAGSA